jgi:hypothetical protein
MTYLQRTKSFGWQPIRWAAKIAQLRALYVGDIMRQLLVAAVIGLAACQSAYDQGTTETISVAPPATPTGSNQYQSTGPGIPARLESAAPLSPTGSQGYQSSAPGFSDQITAAPPANPTGSKQYQY